MNILVIDDHLIVEQGIIHWVSKVIPAAKCHFATNYRESVSILMKSISEKQPIKLVLCDLEFNNDIDYDGYHIAKEFHRIHPNVKMIALTNYHKHRDYMSKAIECGFKSFIKKGCFFEEFHTVLKKVLETDEVVESATMKEINNRHKRAIHSAFKNSFDSIGKLSERQTELLITMADENIKKSKLLAKKMEVGTGTVDTHIKRIMENLDLMDRQEVLLFAKESYNELKKHLNSFSKHE